jgi:plastocyanin domain-containing protein
MKNIIGISASVIVVVAIVIFFIAKGRGGSSIDQSETPNTTNAITMENGTQYIKITARGGYTPRSITAKGGVKTVIRMTSAGAFDCSSSVVIPALNYEKYVQPQQTVEIPIPLEKTTGALQGLCSMGMYNFVVNFE